MAIKLAVDRDQILDNVLGGYGSIANDHPIPPFDPFYASDIPQRQYDPEKAAFHYKKSGHSGALKLHASEATHAGAIDPGCAHPGDRCEGRHRHRDRPRAGGRILVERVDEG